MPKPATTAPPAPPSTRDRIVGSALGLMLRQGFTATSVGEICETAGVTKGAFFHHFESKDVLGEAVLDRFCAMADGMMEQARSAEIEDPLERVVNYCRLMASVMERPDSPRSCIIGNFSQELAPVDPKMQARLDAVMSAWKQDIAKDLEAASQQYPTAADFDAAGLAEHFIAVFEGAIIIAKAQDDPAVVRRSVEHYCRYLRAQFIEPT